MPSAPAVLLAAGALALLTACSAGTAEPAASPAAPSVAATTPSTAATAPPSAAPPATPAVRRLAVTVSGDQVTGDTGTVDVRRGEPVQLTVTSDVADEVHVHGADVGKDVPAGGTVVIDFTQTAAGRFEVELEKRKRTLLRLQVS